MKTLFIVIVGIVMLSSCASKRIDPRCKGLTDRDALKSCIRMTNRVKALRLMERR